jgi:predicted  nucleic acid-binding Zn-ribbon protein
MAFKKKSEPAPPAAAESPAVMAMRTQKAEALKKLDRELSSARRQASAASAELSRARRTVELLSDNRKQIAETFDNLIDAAR